MSDSIHHISTNEFEKEVLRAKNVIVDFYSSECPPCEALAAKFEPLSKTYGSEVKFVKIFRQENRQLAESFGVRSSPTVLFFKNGNQIGDTLSGAIKRKDLIKNLDALLSPQSKEKINNTFTKSENECDVLILGAGPAGLTAALYCTQSRLHTVLVDNALPGGQISSLHQISNYPGFIEPQAGYMLSHYMSEQAKKAGVEYRVSVDVTSVNLFKKEIVVDEIETIRAKKIIIATGSSPKSLNIPGEKEFKGNGISYCATCDAKYYEGKHVVVIGGKDVALEEALFISKFASSITLIHKGSSLQASKILQNKIEADPKIQIRFNISLKEFKKEANDQMIIIGEDSKSKEKIEIKADGIFIFTGMRPKLSDLDDHLEKDENGYIVVDKFMHTNIPDVFAIGDVISKPFRQINIATAEGTIAAMAIAKEFS